MPGSWVESTGAAKPVTVELIRISVIDNNKHLATGTLVSSKKKKKQAGLRYHSMLASTEKYSSGH